MSPLALDFLQVKTIQKEIGRELDEMDLEAARFGEPIFAQKKNGLWVSYFIQAYAFPYDLMPRDADLAIKEQSESIFGYAFNTGRTLLKVPRG